MKHRDDTVRLTVGQALVRYLSHQYTSRDGRRQRAIPAMFGIFGHGNVLGVGQGLIQEGGALPMYQPKNEQAMVHTAIGFAKASRGLATLACSASIGPGSTNMLTGAATATINRTPVLLLPSDTFVTRRQGVVLQELEHPVSADVSVNDAFRPLSRFFDRISRPEQLLDSLPRAMAVLFDPATAGAVTISLHQDVQGEAFDFPVAFFRDRTWFVERRPPSEDEITRAADLVAAAERPFIIVGGGVRSSAAEQHVVELADRLGAPIAETSAGKGAAAGSEWLVGGIGVNGTAVANRLAADADLVIAIGTRLTDFTTGSSSLFQHPEVRFVSINVLRHDAIKYSAMPVLGDAAAATRALVSALAGHPRDTSARRDEVTTLNRRWRTDLNADIEAGAAHARSTGVLFQGEVLRAVNESARAGDWVVAAAGWQPGDLLKSWETPAGSSVHIEFGASCMGHEIPAGIGIRLSDDQAGEILVVIGDGTYLMSPSELYTATQERLKITVVVLDNGGYRSIARLASGNLGRSINNDFRDRSDDGRSPDGRPVVLDLVANAASLGCHSVRATSVDELRRALEEARDHDGPCVIVCPTDPGGALLRSGAFWDLGVPEVSTDPAVTSATASHRAEAQRRQRRFL